MGIHERRIAEGNKSKLVQMIEDGEMNNMKFIELRYNQDGDSTMSILGFDGIYTDSKGNVAKTSNSKVTFYPDNRNKRWGYVLKTPKNIDKLARFIQADQFTIVGLEDKNEVTMYAIKNNINMEPVKHRYEDGLILGRGKSEAEELQEKLKAQEAIIEFLKRQAGVTEDQIAEATASDPVVEEKAKEEAKPLSGVRINKDKLNK
jgi:hypothetical protein